MTMDKKNDLYTIISAWDIGVTSRTFFSNNDAMHWLRSNWDKEHFGCLEEALNLGLVHVSKKTTHTPQITREEVPIKLVILYGVSMNRSVNWFLSEEEADFFCKKGDGFVFNIETFEGSGMHLQALDYD